MSLPFFLPFGVKMRRTDKLVSFLPRAVAPASPVILWFHGGAYIAGSAYTHRGLLGRLSVAAACEVVVPDYRLAPEHLAPAAFDDGCAAFDGLLARGICAERIILAGDSAGGGLAAAVLRWAMARGAPPMGAILLSPWADLTLSGASHRDNAKSESLIPPERLAEVVERIRGTVLPEDPRLSPALASLDAGCPTLIMVGEQEILRDDAIMLANQISSVGGAVTLIRKSGHPHVWPFLAPWVPEARAAILAMAAFTRAISRQRQSGS